MVETSAKTNFLPTAAHLAPHLSQITLIALCSPLNPTGTVFTKEALSEICQLVVQENKQRKKKKTKPLYLLFDQVYWTLTYGETHHVDPVSLNKHMKPYTIYIDGLSKAVAATGVRVGWAMGPSTIISKMTAILGHMGGWSPKPEQVGSARFLNHPKPEEHRAPDQPKFDDTSRFANIRRSPRTQHH